MLSRGLQDKEFLKNEESTEIFLLGRTRCPKQFTRDIGITVAGST